MVGDCGLMGMGRGSDGPMVMVEVGRWRFLLLLLFFFFFFFFSAMVCGRGFGSAWVVGHRSWVYVCVMGFGSCGFWFGVMGLLVGLLVVFVVFGWWLVVILVDGCGYTLVFFFFCSSCRGLWLPRWCCDLWWWWLWWVVVVTMVVATMVVGVVEEVVGWLI